MSDIDSTKNTDNRYSLLILLLVIKQKWLPFNNMWNYACAYSGNGLGFYYAIQTITHPQKFYVYSHEAINGYFHILVAYEKG